MENSFLIPVRAPLKRKVLPGNQKSIYCNRNKTGGEEEKALLSQNLAEEDEIGTGNQLTFKRNPEEDSEHWLLDGPVIL
ncbi:hypothetical protein NDU88_006483 [Pleurodeles waltl]|uniref:Uncharacterized protein n=1 Tax=Pleurodeles waltl TaxID=8319 RepID=A0AAV7MCD4_PLEWA|nr:hypothetical protein NDU88_006483 [Pleurodeles waltl]